MTRYQHLATLLAERIEQGLYRHGEKLPSVRSLSQEHGVSISTVQQAYQTLETMKLITPQPRSGYFVAQHKTQPPAALMYRPRKWRQQRLCWKVTIIAISGGCGKTISAIWRFIPAGYGNIFPAKSVLHARKADFYCG